MRLIWSQEKEISSLTKGNEAPALQFPAVPGTEQSWSSTSLPDANPVPGGRQGEPKGAALALTPPPQLLFHSADAMGWPLSHPMQQDP